MQNSNENRLRFLFGAFLPFDFYMAHFGPKMGNVV
jgi:hypothetical protein